MEYDWDENKNISNQDKHKIDFKTAQKVFDDKHRLIVKSPQNKETRYLTIGALWI